MEYLIRVARQRADDAIAFDRPVLQSTIRRLADALEALVKERDEAVFISDTLANDRDRLADLIEQRFRDGERQGLEKAAICHEIWAGQLYADAQAASEVGCYPCDSNGDLSHYADLHIGHAANIRALITKEQSDADKV